MPRQVETNIGNLTFLRSDLVYLKLNNKQHIKVEDGVIFRNMFKEVVEHEIGIIADARDVQVSASPSSMRFFTTDPTFNKLSKFQAIIVNSTSTKLLANFYVNYLKKKSNARVFNNYEDALIWIEDKVKTFSLAN